MSPYDVFGEGEQRTDRYGRIWCVFVQPDRFPTAVVACMWANGKDVPDEKIAVEKDGTVQYWMRFYPAGSWYMQIGAVADGAAKRLVKELGLEVR